MRSSATLSSPDSVNPALRERSAIRALRASMAASRLSVSAAAMYRPGRLNLRGACVERLFGAEGPASASIARYGLAGSSSSLNTDLGGEGGAALARTEEWIGALGLRAVLQSFFPVLEPARAAVADEAEGGVGWGVSECGAAAGVWEAAPAGAIPLLPLSTATLARAAAIRAATSDGGAARPCRAEEAGKAAELGGAGTSGPLSATTLARAAAMRAATSAGGAERLGGPADAGEPGPGG